MFALKQYPISLQIDFQIRQLELSFCPDNKVRWISALLAYQTFRKTNLDEFLTIHLDNLCITFGQDQIDNYLSIVYPQYFQKAG